MNVKNRLLFVLIAVCSMSLYGCSFTGANKDPLDPSKPITVTVWHYYNGQIKDRFDDLVGVFNETIGVDRGLVVDAQSLGDVQQLADAVYNAANHTIGALPLPDAFMAYPENAYRVNQIVELVNFETLFSKEELERYRADFLEEGRFGSEQKLLILPVAKSTENLYVNKTFWDDFSNDTGADIKKLSTWEGLVEIAQLYYEHTGKAFVGIDASANYMLLSSMQLGTEMYIYNGEKVRFNLTTEVAKYIWNYYYIPHIKGYFLKNGRFSSDDAKIGGILAYTGSTAGAAYFPMDVTIQQKEVYDIEPMTLPYPYFGSGKPYAIQQGAGMCVTKSDEAHEYGAGIFLKWFTEPEQNLEFAVSTGYFPVMDEALSSERLVEQVKISKVVGAAIPKMVETTNYMFANYSFYNNKPFEGSYDLRVLLDSHLFSKITRDLELMNKSVEGGKSREAMIESLISDEEFEKWYSQINKEASLILDNN